MHGEKYEIIYEGHHQEQHDYSYEHVVALLKEVEFKDIERNVVSEQWVVQIEISRVGELQYLEPKSADAVKRNDKAEQKGNDVGYQVQPLHVGVLAGHDFFKVALLQMSQVYVQKHRHYYEQRNSELELSEQLCVEHADVAHFTEPHPVGYKVGKRH